MKRPRIDEKLTLLADFGETEAICVEVLDNPSTEEGVLLKVMGAVRSNKASKSGSSIAMDRKLAPPSRMSSSKPSTAK